MAWAISPARLKSGAQLREALCASTDSQVPSGWSDATLNVLLDMADTPKAERDPLAFKQHLASLSPALASLKLRQRKATHAALEDHLSNAAQLDLPRRFGPWSCRR